MPYRLAIALYVLFSLLRSRQLVLYNSLSKNATPFLKFFLFFLFFFKNMKIPPISRSFFMYSGKNYAIINNNLFLFTIKFFAEQQRSLFSGSRTITIMKSNKSLPPADKRSSRRNISTRNLIIICS